MTIDRRRFIYGLAALPVFTPGSVAADTDIRIDAEFPGGNITLERVVGDTVYVAPDLRDTQKDQWWFWWNFRLRARAGKNVRVVFSKRNPIGMRGPAASSDGGKTWQWLGAKAVRADKQEWSFEASVPEGKEDVRYAFAVPYQESHLKSFLAEYKDNPALKVEELCRSRKGRSVELLRAGSLDIAKARGTVILTSRHHACECLATYAMEGFLRAVLAENETGKKWRSNWEVLAIPFMDKDGVEDGDQGKNRAPHDHNRDYNAKPLYPEVAALMKLGGEIKGRVRAAMDLHCPHIRGEWNDRVYIVGAPEKELGERQQAFAQTLEKVQTGSIKFRARDYLPFGTSWNTKANFTQGRNCSAWAREAFPNARLVQTMEIAYADALGCEVNADTARALGRDLAEAMAVTLAEQTPPK